MTGPEPPGRSLNPPSPTREPLPIGPSTLTALCTRILALASGLKSSVSNSRSQRSGVSSGLRRANTSAVLRGLERKGLAERRTSPNDLQRTGMHEVLGDCHDEATAVHLGGAS